MGCLCALDWACLGTSGGRLGDHKSANSMETSRWSQRGPVDLDSNRKTVRLVLRLDGVGVLLARPVLRSAEVTGEVAEEVTGEVSGDGGGRRSASRVDRLQQLAVFAQAGGDLAAGGRDQGDRGQSSSVSRDHESSINRASDSSLK